MTPARQRVSTRFRHRVVSVLNVAATLPASGTAGAGGADAIMDDRLSDLPAAARRKAEQLAAEMSEWAGELQDVIIRPDPGRVLVILTFAGGAIAFVAPFGEVG